MAAWIPIVIQAADEEGHIDIGGERLALDDGDVEGWTGWQWPSNKRN